MPYTCWRDAIGYQDLIFLNFNRPIFKAFSENQYFIKTIWVK